jgi:hypothetical protein
VVPFSALLKRKATISSEGEDDNVPLVSLVSKNKLDVLADVSAVPLYPKGEACIGLEVVHDFGVAHGVCKGSIVSEG